MLLAPFFSDMFLNDLEGFWILRVTAVVSEAKALK